MSDKELRQLKSDILKEQKKVATSKTAAQKYLTELGLLTKGGNLKKEFKSLR